jgi:hypothetical protein
MSDPGCEGVSRVSRRRLDEIDAVMSPLDRDVLLLVQQLRLATGAQLRRCFWPASERAARRTLKRLGEWRVLDRLPARLSGGHRGGSQSFTWYVGPVGLRLLDRIGFTGKRLITPSDRYRRHTLGVTELVVRLVEADRDASLELIAWQSEPACWRPFLGHGGGRVILKPDLALRIGVGAAHEDRWLIEWDMATEAQATLATKLRAHLAYRASGQELGEHGVDPRVLWLVPDVRRAEMLRRVIDRLRPDEGELFAVTTHSDAVAFVAHEARS